MDRLTPRPRRRRPVSRGAATLISYVWIIASLALPAVGIALIANGGNLLPSAEGTSHTVRAGETLTAIALQYGISVQELVAYNGLNNPDLIYVGQVLVIPPRTTTAAQTPELSYTIQRGDSLSLIAKRYNVTVEEIAQLNGLTDPNAIVAGKVLRIPLTEQTVAEVQNEVDTSYTLQRGDSLYRVSLIYGVTVDDLLAANNLASPNSIYPGLQLRIPTSPQELAQSNSQTPSSQPTSTGGRSYTVGLGDSLNKIAIHYGVTVDGLVAANALASPDRIYVGQTLIIPAPGASARPAPAQSAVAHTVTTGETLAEIAVRYGVTMQALAVANGISNPSQIFAGEVLSIPAAQAGSLSVQYASTGDGLCSSVVPDRSGTGYFIRPVRGYRITQLFSAWHSGIDLALPIGSPVFAADGGTVIYAGWNPAGYGKLVVLDHGDGWRTYYAHLSEIHVSCGEWVARGTQLGAVGSTGNSTGPHLHFEMLRFGIAVNPTGYIRF